MSNIKIEDAHDLWMFKQWLKVTTRTESDDVLESIYFIRGMRRRHVNQNV